MNEFTIQVSNTANTRSQVVRVAHNHWMGAVDKAESDHRWGTRFQVLTQNGRDFQHGATIYK